MKLKKIKLGRLIFSIAGLLLLLFIFNVYQGHLKLKKIDQEITVLQDDINNIEEKKKELEAKIEHVNSKEFIEEIAREELGLVKEGEILYITIEK